MPGDVPDYLTRELNCENTLYRTPSRRRRHRRYYRTARVSRVDESLFGVCHREVHVDNVDCFPQRQKESKAWKEQRKKEHDNTRAKTVKIITNDSVRYLKHPECRFADDQSVMLSAGDFRRIMMESQVITAQQRQDEADRAFKEKLEKKEEVEERKKAIRERDFLRKKNEKLNELEQEEKENAEVLLKEAKAKRLEQEDELKHLNQLILNAKVQTIRDHQLQEQEEIKKELKEEDERLYCEMEKDRINAIRIQEEIERKRREERLVGAMKIMEQIKENEEERLLDLERKDQENEIMRKHLDKLCEEEAEMRKRELEGKFRYKDELDQCNEDVIKRKEQDAELDKMISENVVQFQKEKAEREEAREREQERIRREKEEETARLRALQERAIDEKAIRDGLQAKRAQEESERNWRKREAEDARRKAENEMNLKLGRQKQIQDKLYYLGIEAQLDKVDFVRVLRAQQELLEKERKQEDIVSKKRKGYLQDLRAQIREREQEKMEERIAVFEEGVKMKREDRIRLQKLEEAKEQKLAELRKIGLPEKYLTRIENKSRAGLKPRIGSTL